MNATDYEAVADKLISYWAGDVVHGGSGPETHDLASRLAEVLPVPTARLLSSNGPSGRGVLGKTIRALCEVDPVARDLVSKIALRHESAIERVPAAAYVKGRQRDKHPLAQMHFASLPTPTSRVRILFLGASPRDTPQLNTGSESRDIALALRASPFGSQFDIQLQASVRICDLEPALLLHRPQIIHFSGHGNQEEELVLEDDSGNGEAVDADALAELFSMFTPDLRCAVLNTCNSWGLAQRLVTRGIDCAIGMSQRLDDASAIRFAVAFYQALGHGVDVRAAFQLGRIELGMVKLRGLANPHLVTRRRCNPSKIAFV